MDSTFCVNTYSWFGNDDNPSRDLVDALVKQWFNALEEMGHNRKMFGVCENGWPSQSTDGNSNANPQTAKQFNDILRDYADEYELVYFLFEGNDELNKPTWATVEPYWYVFY